MDSFEINKILGALLGTCLILVAMHIASEAIFTREAPAKPGYEIAVKEQPAGGAAAAAVPAEQPIETVLASASPQHGAQVAKECEACHNLQEGQGPKVGPDLYGVVDRPIASVSGFNYTDAIKGAAKTLGGKWTFDALNKWLTKPSAVAPGTAMTFAGLSSEKQRADVIAYLDTLSPHPVPLPKAAEAPPAKPAAAAAAAAPAAPAAAPANPAPAATAPATNPPAAGAAPAAPSGGAATPQH
ncbi:MAG TPA: cytochrome c family protein [Xanthobacteraceae bacterium]|jgi:cytochrome c|nr:cytochrome c family protein [Xanthobacteraceae bacterium]